MKIILFLMISISCFAQETQNEERITVSPNEISNILIKEEKVVDSFTDSNYQKAKKNSNVTFCKEHKSFFGTYSFCQKTDKNVRELVYKKYNDDKEFIIKRAHIEETIENKPIINYDEEEYL